MRPSIRGAIRMAAIRAPHSRSRRSDSSCSLFENETGDRKLCRHFDWNLEWGLTGFGDQWLGRSLAGRRLGHTKSTKRRAGLSCFRNSSESAFERPLGHLFDTSSAKKSSRCSKSECHTDFPLAGCRIHGKLKTVAGGCLLHCFSKSSAGRHLQRHMGLRGCSAFSRFERTNASERFVRPGWPSHSRKSAGTLNWL